MTGEPVLDAPQAAQPQAASERIAAHLRQAIISGEIPPGARLRQEEIAERLNASRLPVREALRMLEAEGLTEHVANKGSRVPVLDLAEVDVLYQMRERLEPLALSQSLPHLTPEQIGYMGEVQERIEAREGLADFLLLDREFHLTSYAGCPSERLLGTVTQLWNSTQHYRRVFMVLGGSERRYFANCEHRLLLNAVQQHDEVEAERQLTSHIRRTRIELVRHPEVFEASGG